MIKKKKQLQAEKIIEQQAFDLSDRDMRISHLESKILKNNDTTK